MPENATEPDVKPTLTSGDSGINHYSPAVQLLIWMGVFSVCFIVAQSVSGMIILAYYKVATIQRLVANTADLNVLRYAQMLASIIGFLLPALIFSKLKSAHAPFSYANADKGMHPVYLILVPLLIVTFYPLIDVSFYINQWMPWDDWMKDSQVEYKAIVDALLADTSIWVLVLNFITVALLPAVCEEWIFRGTLQKVLSEYYPIHLAVLFSSIMFSLVHAEFSGFLPRILLGMLLGYLYYYSGSLWTNIFAHLVNNGAQVVLMYLNHAGITSIDLDQPDMPEWWEIIVYTLGFIAVWYAFYRFSQKNKKSTFV